MRSRSILRTILQPLAIAVMLAVVVRAAVKIYSIPTESMAPTLTVGDHIVVTPYVFAATPQRGHVIVFRAGDEVFVKRVVAVPGDLVDSRLGQARVGGYTLAEPYLLRPGATGAIQAQVVPANAFFVMGDNRADSLDSRSWGAVPRERIVGRARLILWSSAGAAAYDTATATTISRDTAPARSGHTRRLFKWIE